MTVTTATTATTASTHRFPDVARPDARTVLIGPRFAGGPERQLELAQEALHGWEHEPWPDGLLSASCFLSTDGLTVLTYELWADEAARAAETVAFRLYRSVIGDGEGDGGPRVPGCIAIPSFDTDGSERQRAIVDSLVDGPLARPIPGLIAAHFHLSTDGTRVFNYAEWTDARSHEAAMSGAVLQASARLTQGLPGIRNIGCPRYHLHRTVTGPAV